jgi:hypothetical protein
MLELSKLAPSKLVPSKLVLSFLGLTWWLRRRKKLSELK